MVRDGAARLLTMRSCLELAGGFAPGGARMRQAAESKRDPKAPFKSASGDPQSLLDLGFLELDVLARHRVVLLLDQLVGHGARVLLGDVVEAGVRRRHELDLDGDRFGHVENLKFRESGAGPSSGRQFGRKLAAIRRKSRFSAAKTPPPSYAGLT